MKQMCFKVLMTAVLSAFCLAPLAADEVEFLGAGATFPYPYYSKIFDAYYLQTGVKINYQAIGSGGGILQLLNKTVDFGGTDAFMNDEELAKATGPILHLPTCLGAVVVIYDLPGEPALRLTAQVIADIFMGRITKWNDPALAQINPDLHLPDLNIVVVHRSDGSGTTFIFSDYLSKVSPGWEKTVGRGKSLNWPAGLGAKGNPGVAGLVKQLPGSIGYVELVYAEQNDMAVAAVENRAGAYIQPSIASVSLAADIELPDDARVSITDTDAPEGYPISGFTWLIFYQEQSYGGRSEQQARGLVDLMWWVIHEGQQYAEDLQYAPLPEQARGICEDILGSVVYQGQRIYP